MNFKKDKSLKYLTETMRKKYGSKLKRIILFGSRARNDYNVESDYDLLVVFDKLSSKIKNAVDEISGEILYEFNELYSIFPISEKDFKLKKHNPLFLNIEKEGILI
jgi:uncharacterized protein